MPDAIVYVPPPTVKEFIKWYLPGEIFYTWIVGPWGSAKTTGNFFKLVRMASLQAPWRDGVRRTRAVIVRNTAPQLKDTTMKSWDYWFQDGVAGEANKTDKNFTLRFNNKEGQPVECEVLFRPLDTPDDIARVLSLEVTFGIVDEFVEEPRDIIEAISGRCGRYPPKNEGGATNWGMWGASNVSTEDNWWYDNLHDNPAMELYSLQRWEEQEARAHRRALKGWLDLPTNAAYFLQPSGFSPMAENLENLPPYKANDNTYYHKLAVGKTQAWIKQNIEVEWGFSAAGQPVVPTFKDMHIAKSELAWNPHLPVIMGLDPGITASACIFMQYTLEGQLLVLGELVQQGYNAQRLIRERIRPYVASRFPGCRLVIAPDPAGSIRAQTDSGTIVREFQRVFGSENVFVESNNRLPLRLEAIEHFTTRLVSVGPALQVDPRHCRALIRSLKGGWKFIVDLKKEQPRTPEPDKNIHSHPGDAFGYGCRYFHRQQQRLLGPNLSGRLFTPPRDFGAGSYHVR